MKRTMTPGAPRCPHDGGRCNHGCLATCMRKHIGAGLSVPWEGFPLPTDAPIRPGDTVDYAQPARDRIKGHFWDD